MEVGLRVVRGPDWKWGNQDDGDGHLGTVVEIGKPGSTTSPDKTVVVQWDSGSRTNYRVGYQGAYDLRIFDNASVGVKHPNIICDTCKKQGVQGMRWKCTKCHDFDLCTSCYMSDKHDLLHSFQRFDTATSKGVKVPKRLNSVKVQAWGIVSGARVVRGPDWDWGNQDGGEGKIGKVTDVRGWDSESGRSVAAITWASGSTNVYRVGHKGKVDLKYVQAASAGNYYRDHLPVLGEFPEQTTSTGISHQFKVGDKVWVNLEVEILKIMQEGHGGWNPRMAEFIGKIGAVHRITERGDVRVQYDGCSNRWTFHPGALTKVNNKVQKFTVGDTVRMSDNIHTMKELQKNHGEWNDNMKETLGKTGQILKVYPDGDLRVQVGIQTWTFNPLNCFPVPHGVVTDMNNTMGHNEREEMPAASLSAILDELAELHTLESGPDRLVREAAQGHTEVVKDIIKKFPDKVDQMSSGKTALQVASHQGHGDIVKLLLLHGANLELQDEDGDTALHYSAFGNQSEVIELLLIHQAKINALNNGECSALHVAVNKQHVDCVRVLLKHKANVNIQVAHINSSAANCTDPDLPSHIVPGGLGLWKLLGVISRLTQLISPFNTCMSLQDAYGDTALHDAIGKDNLEIIDLLINFPGIDFTLRNKRGFNVLHHAALKGNNCATEKILQKCRQIVDMKKDDGFSALHLAALNGHRDVTNTLLVTGQADIEIRNNRQQTPLLLAVSQGHVGILELLVARGADVNVEDEDGDTCLHLSLMRHSIATEKEDSPMLESIRSQLGLSKSDDQNGVALACYLAQQGASLTHKNHQNKTPLELITDPRVDEMVRQFATATAIGRIEEDCIHTEVECMVCSEQLAVVRFEPCGHIIACQDCCIKMKRCIQCKTQITEKIGPDSQRLSSGTSPAPIDTPSLLQRKLNEMEENILCNICMERRRNLAFLCGHTVCNVCGDALKNCHMCRKPITKKILLFS